LADETDRGAGKRQFGAGPTFRIICGMVWPVFRQSNFAGAGIVTPVENEIRLMIESLWTLKKLGRLAVKTMSGSA